MWGEGDSLTPDLPNFQLNQKSRVCVCVCVCVCVWGGGGGGGGSTYTSGNIGQVLITIYFVLLMIM